MKFLGLFRVLDPKLLRLIWFKPNLSLKIGIFFHFFQKKVNEVQNKKTNSNFSYFFPIFKIILACIFANNTFLQRYAKVRPRTGHFSTIFLSYF